MMYILDIAVGIWVAFAGHILQEKKLDSKGRDQFFVSLNGMDQPDVQAVSLVHEAIHIDIREAVSQTTDFATFVQMRADEELFVQERTAHFLQSNQALAMAGVNYMKLRHGDGIQTELALFSQGNYE